MTYIMPATQNSDEHRVEVQLANEPVERSFNNVGSLGDAEPPANSNKSSLRPYQVAAITALERSIAHRGSSFVHIASLPTGSGKTSVGVTIAMRSLAQRRTKQVVWLAPRWELLDQAAKTLKLMFPGSKFVLGRFGGSAGDMGVPESSDASIVFSTVQTWYSRRESPKNRLIDNNSQLVILDESHWAIEAGLGQRLRELCHGRTPIIGLTATPRNNVEGDQIVYVKSFADLCSESEGGPYLATPRVMSVETGIHWNPVTRLGVIANESIVQLSQFSDRNSLIVETVAKAVSTGMASRVILFACDRNHADLLSAALNARNCKSVAIHSGFSKQDNASRLTWFRSGSVKVAVSCTMLAVGLDVPEIDAVVIARPSQSLVLLAQMIGRGARLTKNKTQFRVIEFTDRLMGKYRRVFHATDYLGPVKTCHVFGGSRVKRPETHSESSDQPTFQRVNVLDLPGLDFAKDQTFGVEIEITYDGFGTRDQSWHVLASKVLECLREAANWPVASHPAGYHGDLDVTTWRVTYDGSCGLEVVSPILVNEEGLLELGNVCQGLRRLLKSDSTFYVDYKCGLHVTLATRLTTEPRRQAFLNRFSRLESGLYTLIAPSRLYQFNGKTYDKRRRCYYSAPIRELPEGEWESCLKNRCALGRYRSINVTKQAGDMRLLEIRMHQGTTDYRKIISWISLWMKVFNEQRYAWNSKPDLRRVFAGGNQRLRPERADWEDLFKLLFEERIFLSQNLEELLRKRRTELRSSWSKVLPKRVEGWQRAGWYRDTLGD